ncbi:hypothetical protein KORDIASMS9_03558 [Kordia sp. SMS9]|uniref:hypothetical protein n=1 Tax=Kordia sp. SMS9 TaxID=2282170 RepID=UPI000E0DD6DA|nr:hypothetical protein [Kordia sp. SMS9]AXG71301.1 hypothetical protein KORDIASMS9_03558 [Kordia sp. SMS9]
MYKKITLLLVFCSLCAIGQEKNQATSKLESLLTWTHLIDRVIEDAKGKHFDFTHISHRIKEGSMILIDSINGAQVEIGSGAFTTDTYKDKNTNKIIKSSHSDVIDYNENAASDLKGKIERLKIDIYYDNEKPVFATYLKLIKRNKKIINREFYYVQLDADDPSQKEVREYILRLSKDQIAHKR